MQFPYAPVMRRHKSVFIHIPRTGGTSIWASLGATPYWRQHEPWHTYAAANPRRFKDYWKFAIVRDPVDRAYSAYKYLEGGGNKKSDIPAATRVRAYRGFDEFLREGLLNGGFGSSWLFLPQTFFIFDQDDNLRVDYIGRFEDMNATYEEVYSRLKCRSEKQMTLNVRRKEGYEPVSAESKDVLRMIYSRDYRLLGY
ncbi:sulfotransferase family 2 domain-containing protein [Thalassococcus sp. BH17M4-6]|uniref:sulfotransferase family 2 domain-containing protein n=1 Tax=Thalassococcus sp. BH17M4-6 TaxID=3413148 RepID=UPI003BC6454A